MEAPPKNFVVASVSAGGISEEGVTGDRPSAPPLRRVPRVSAEEFRSREHYWRNSPLGIPYETPVIVEGVLSPSECDRYCDVLVSAAGDAVVDVQRKVRRDREDDEDGGGETMTTEIYQMTLADALGAMMDSSYEDARFAFVEGLLDGGYGDDDDAQNLAEMRARLEDAREGLFRRRGGGDETNGGADDDDPNLFDAFPPSVRPTDCVVLAGEGATSTLHRDPFEWTGTSLCLEGTKVWRFVPPPSAVAVMMVEEKEGPARTDDVAAATTGDNCDDLVVENSGVEVIDETLGAYRLASVAWDAGLDDGGDEAAEGKGDGGERPGALTLSAGWQSDLSLFAHRDDGAVPSAQMLAEMEYHDSDEDEQPSPEAIEEKRRVLDALAADPDALRPNIPHDDDGDGDGVLTPALAPCCWATAQHPGEMLVIPAHWWHQTYAPEPSVAVASQRCGSTAGRDGPRVVRHALETALGGAGGGGDADTTAVPESLRRALLQGCPTSGALENPQDTVRELFSFLRTL